MQRLTVTKTFNICYGHRLPEYNGPCCQTHGHNSKVMVSLAKDEQKLNYAEIYPTMVMDFREMKSVIGPVVMRLDHVFLNDLPEYSEAPPTAEHIAQELFRQITDVLDGADFPVKLVSVRVYETEDAYAEIVEV